ncbi:MAG TPA: hypothetical protein VF941_13215 [Clostridia bacterium]
MDDKAFELLTKMYSEFTSKIEGIQNDLNEFRKENIGIKREAESRLAKIETILENEIVPDIKASLEGYQMVYEKQKEHDKRLESIDNKLEKQEMEITIIKGGREKNRK